MAPPGLEHQGSETQPGQRLHADVKMENAEHEAEHDGPGVQAPQEVTQGPAVPAPAPVPQAQAQHMGPAGGVQHVQQPFRQAPQPQYAVNQGNVLFGAPAPANQNAPPMQNMPPPVLPYRYTALLVNNMQLENRMLIGQIQALQARNAQLLATIHQRDQDIAYMRGQLAQRGREREPRG